MSDLARPDGPDHSAQPEPASSLGPSGECSSRGPSLLRRLTLCRMSLCETFKTTSDKDGIWGECQKCGKRVGYTDRASLRYIGRREYEAEMRRRAAQC